MQGKPEARLLTACCDSLSFQRLLLSRVIKKDARVYLSSDQEQEGPSCPSEQWARSIEERQAHSTSEMYSYAYTWLILHVLACCVYYIAHREREDRRPTARGRGVGVGSLLFLTFVFLFFSSVRRSDVGGFGGTK